MALQKKPLRTPHSPGPPPSRAGAGELGTRVGFSLIELVIALAIMSIGLVGAMRVFPMGLRSSKRTEIASRAAIIASRTLETLKMKPAGELEPGTTQVQEEIFSVMTEISELQAEGLVEPKRVRKAVVTVSWEQNDRQRSLSFVTYVWDKAES